MLLIALCSCSKNTSDSEKGPMYGMPFDNETKEYASITIRKKTGYIRPRPKEDPNEFSSDRLIIAIWKNGNAIWSKDKLNGGTPYFKGTIGKAGFDKIINDLLKSEFFKKAQILSNKFGDMKNIFDVFTGNFYRDI